MYRRGSLVLRYLGAADVSLGLLLGGEGCEHLSGLRLGSVAIRDGQMLRAGRMEGLYRDLIFGC